jgi:hypothetical protein
VVLFLDRFMLNLFRNMLSSSSQHNVWQMDHLENWLLLKSYVQIPKVSRFRWAFFLAHTESFVTSSFRSSLARVSVVNLLYHLADQLFRGFHYADDRFWARRLKWLKIFCLWFPGFRSKKPKCLNFRRFGVLRFCFPLLVIWVFVETLYYYPCFFGF